MSFIQEFVEVQLSKTMGCSVRQHLQVCHSAVEDLLINLQSLRSMPKTQTILVKVKRIEAFLETKQEMLRLIQADQQQPLVQWLIHHQLQSSLLVELVKKEQSFIAQSLKQLTASIFLGEQKLEDYIKDNQIIRNCLSLLTSLQEDITMGRTPNREKLISIDSVEGFIANKITAFHHKISIFNQQIRNFIKELYRFQDQISQQLRRFFCKTMLTPNTQHVIDEQNIVLQPLNRSVGHQLGRTIGEMRRPTPEYPRQTSFNQSAFPNKNSYNRFASQIRNKEQASQLGLHSQLKLNSTHKEDRYSRSMLGQNKTFYR